MTSEIAKASECSHCGEDVGPDSWCNSYEENGQVFCSDCWHELYQFECCLCAEYEYVEHQDRLLMVFDARSAGIEKAGLYEIIDLPYYYDGYVEASLRPGALRFLRSLTKDEATCQDYPCGHLCRRCQEKAREG